MSARIEGTGLFTSAPSSVAITPQDAGGLVFVQAGQRITASLDRLSTTPIHPAFAQMSARNTNLAAPESDAPRVLTTEHVLAACAGLSIWHAELALQGPEIPIDDGSARVFVDALRDAAPTNVEPIQLRSPITVTQGDARIEALPASPDEHPAWTYELDYGQGAPIPRQTASWVLGDRDAFTTQVAPARTFSLRSEAEAMKAAGLFQAFGPEQLLVIDDDGAPIGNIWRFDNEAARHKLLDLIGDLALLGRPVHARIRAVRSGHALNHELAAAITEHITA